MSEVSLCSKHNKTVAIVDGMACTLCKLEARIRELEAERRRDALGGQAALDEANNRIRELEAQNVKLRQMMVELIASSRNVREAAEAELARVCEALRKHHQSMYPLPNGATCGICKLKLEQGHDTN